MEKKNLKVEDICPRCEGKESVDGIYVCSKCNGSGKVDWVTKAVDRPRRHSALDSINVRRVVSYVEKVVGENIFEDKSTFELNINSFLGYLKKKKGIYDYKADVLPDGSVNIYLKPSNAIEIIKIEMKIV